MEFRSVFDDPYLTVANLSDNVKKGHYVPKKCAQCERIISNKKNVLKKGPEN